MTRLLYYAAIILGVMSAGLLVVSAALHMWWVVALNAVSLVMNYYTARAQRGRCR